MATKRDGFPEAGLRFLGGLARNNTREWFLARKDEFEEQVRRPMIALVERIDAELARFAPECVVEPSKAIPRMNRDVRFSADKSPYKTTVSAIFPCRGRDKSAASGFYVGVSAKGAQLVAGAYMPDPASIALIRKRISSDPTGWSRVAASKDVARSWGLVRGEGLVRVPKGFDAAHPAADDLKRKQWYLAAELPRELVTSSRLVPEISERFRAATPLVRWLDAALSSR